MKKTTLFVLLVLALLISACGKETPTPTATPATPAAAETDTPDWPDITGAWALAASGDYPLYSALTVLSEYDFITVTPDYIQVGGVAYPWHWETADRLVLENLVSPYGTHLLGPLDVQREGGHLRLTVPGYPDAWLDFKPASAAAEASPADATADAAATAGAPFAPAPTPYVACPGQMETRLWVGGFATVSPGPPNRVRTGPGKSYSTAGMANAGELLEILDGPECANGWTWYQVRVRQSGLTGWTAEGDGQSEYWLQPCGSGTECGAGLPENP